MKKLVLALFLGLFAFTVKAQEVENILTSGKWFIESIQEKGEEPELSSNKNDEWMVFSKDGKVEENHFGDSKTFSWTYDKTKKMIKLSGEETIFHRVIEITENKLIVELVEDLENADDNLMITYVK
ncbi:lipocalin family protein [uncultured Tenacibaculum sp.]|uniref:lipocalin family protein n=1 Tax=uncultured Tenacibaculum sp. TaxID=174713 RepID=UPI00260C01D4|nr:lipocalin family protein [uncultured Tenacibaculum sp.]